MPIRSYFLVMGPALAALLWCLGWYLEPSPPARPQAAVAAQAAKPASPARADPRPVAFTTGQAALQAGPDLQDGPEATKPVEAAKSVAQQAPKPKKRKQVTHRRKHPDHYGAYAYSRPYPQGYGRYPRTYGSRYAGSPPFLGHGGW
jgi:hypothetical protein